MIAFSLLHQKQEQVKLLFNKVKKQFLPKYEVECISYQLIPGMPVNQNKSKHQFEKGAAEEAMKFYSKVVHSNMTKLMAPVEVNLKRGGRIIESTEIGPVQDVKKFKIVYKK